TRRECLVDERKGDRFMDAESPFECYAFLAPGIANLDQTRLGLLLRAPEHNRCNAHAEDHARNRNRHDFPLLPEPAQHVLEQTKSPRLNWLIVKEAAKIAGQFERTDVPTAGHLIDRFQDDCLKILGKPWVDGARCQRFVMKDSVKQGC